MLAQAMRDSSRASNMVSPLVLSLFTKTVKKKGSEVLYMIDPIEESAVQQLEVEEEEVCHRSGNITGEDIAACHILHASGF
jgi:hypothetical protein